MADLSSAKALAVRQIKEWTEIFTDFETANKYAVHDELGNQLFFAGEEKGNFLLRNFLKSSRPFTIKVVDNEGKTFLTIDRPFKFVFAECDVKDATNNSLGKIKWQFAIVRRKYIVLDNMGNEIYKIYSPALKPWTFQIIKGDRQIGIISKKWTGFMKEMFSDADNFGISFTEDIPANHKAILLGSVFLIDFMHFEDRG